MPATYEPIASQALGSNAGTITFSNIPGTYTDLVLVILSGGDVAGASLRCRFNSDATALYSYTHVQGQSGDLATSGRGSSQTSGIIGAATSGSSAALDNFYIAHILNYANTNVFKTTISSNASSTREVGRAVSLWRSTDAITSISVAYGSAFPTRNMLAGTTATLFGIKASA